MKTKKILAKNIADYLSLHKLSPEDLASKCGVSRQYIYKLMKAEQSPTLDLVDSLADAMGCSFNEAIEENYFKQFEAKIIRKNKTK